jgi:hypothetical protein
MPGVLHNADSNFPFNASPGPWSLYGLVSNASPDGRALTTQMNFSDTAPFWSKPRPSP